MKNFISGRIVLDTKKPVAHIKFQNLGLQIGEYTCYFQTDSKMIVIEPSSAFHSKMEKFSDKIKYFPKFHLFFSIKIILCMCF